jgi:hypothetical protein
MAPKTGHKMKFYRNTGTAATPVWALVAEIGDLSIPDFSMGIAELKRRASNYSKGLATLIGMIAVEFRLLHGLGAVQFAAIKDDFLAGTTREYAILDGLVATVGTQGLRMPALLENFPWDQNLEDVSGHDMRAVLAYHEESSTEIDPSWMTVSS